MSVLYVYALVPADGAAPRSLRVRGRCIQLFPAGTVQAAVERLAAPPALSEGSLRAQHEIVVALARRFDALLPVRFGASLDAAELERLLTRRQVRLRRALEIVRGCEQMTVRIFGPADSPVTSPRPRTGTAYLEVRRKMASGLATPAAKRIRAAVRPVVARERIEPGQGRVRATFYHLISRGRAAVYRSLVMRSADGITPHEQVVVSGPWPPFAFAPDLRS